MGECYIRLLLISDKQTACFPADKWRFDKTPLSWCSDKDHIFVDLEIQDKFHCQELIIMQGVSPYEGV